MSNPPNLYLSYQLPTGEYQELPLVENQEITIGRFKTSTIKLSLPSVSRQHAKIFYENGSFWIKDLGSSNGSYINKEQVHHAKISLGDLVQCGEFAMMVKNRNQLSAKPSAMTPIDQYSSLPPVHQSPVSLKVMPSYPTNQSPLPFNTTASSHNSAVSLPPKFTHQNENSISPQSHTAKPNQLQSVNLKPVQQAQPQSIQPVQNSQNRVPAFQPIQQPQSPTKSQQIENANSQKPALIHAPTQVPGGQVTSQTPKSPIIDHKSPFVSPSSLNQATPKAVHLPNQSSINQTHQSIQNQNSIKGLTPVAPSQPQGMKSLEFPFDTPTKEAGLPIQGYTT
jgi:predicted component of type VI protein secretion system